MSEIIYKALSRPAMLFGVPMTPMILVCTAIALVAVWSTHKILLLAILPAVLIMKHMAKKDDLAFRLLWFKLTFATNSASKKFFGGLQAYSASNFEKLDKLHNYGYPKLTPLNGLEQMPSIAKYLPYQTLVGDVVITKDFDFLTTWQIEGIPFESESDESLAFAKSNLNNLLKTFANSNISFYFHSCRVPIDEKSTSNFPNEFLQSLNEQYYANFRDGKLKENKLFLTAVYSPLTRVEKPLLKKDNLEKRIEQLNKIINDFHKICVQLEEGLKNFAPKRLKTYEKDGVKFSSQLEFYNYLISGIFKPVRTPNAPIFLYLNGNLNEILFARHTMQLKTNTEKSIYAKIIEIKDYPNESWAGIFDILMYSDVEYTITQSFVPMNNREALSSIKLQQRRLVSAQDDALSQIEALTIAKDELQSGEISFGTYHFSIIIYGDSQEDVTKKANFVISELSDCGFLMEQASTALAATYFAQFPSNFGIRPRQHVVSTANFASFIALHNFPKGKKDKNQWGEAVTVLKTTSKQPFFFNFHEANIGKNDFGEFLLGNTLILGKSGGGKTAFMNFMLDQLTKYADTNSFPADIPQDKRKATFFYLDKDKGAMGNIIAAGGKYITMDAGNPTGFNPFMCEPNAENRRRLKVLVKMLVTRTGKALTTLEEENLNNAVDSVLDMIPNPQDRRYGMSLLVQNLTEDNDETNSMKSILKAWTYGNEFGWVFDNEYDTLDFSDGRLIYGLDGTDLLKDDEINSFVAYYLFWRVFDCLDGRRFALVIDELWDWLKNKTVAKEVFDKEKTIRKLNGFLMLGTQSVEDVAQSSIATALIEQSATIILLSNPKAKKVDYCDHLSMTEEEFNFVKTTNPDLYRFLIKKGVDERVIATIDLSGVDKITLKILSTAKPYVESIQAINDNANLNYEEKLKAIKELYR